MTDVIIIGAGMAGLSTALELKRLKISTLLLEAGPKPGGRALGHRLPSGIMADLGAHWLHGGQDNPLKQLLEQYHIPYREDKSQHLFIYQDGKMRKSSGDSWLKKATDEKKAKRIKQELESDCSMTELAADEKGRRVLADFALMWDGIDPPLEPSAREFITDESTPGGLQPEGGIGELIEKMAEDIGPEHIQCNAAVSAISASTEGILAQTVDGKQWRARRAIFTASPGVIKNGLVKFDPPAGSIVQSYLSGLIMGKMNKIIVELDLEFFKQRKIPEDMSIEFLDNKPPHFCHLRSAGLPLINLFVSGSQAEKVESMKADELLRYVSHLLEPVTDMKGFEAHIITEPMVTRWVTNPYTRGSYASCLPGVKRSPPILENHICFCGDSFSEHYPASLAGAFLSGKLAAYKVAGSMQ